MLTAQHKQRLKFGLDAFEYPRCERGSCLCLCLISGVGEGLV